MVLHLVWFVKRKEVLIVGDFYGWWVGLRCAALVGSGLNLWGVE